DPPRVMTASRHGLPDSNSSGLGSNLL
ncbi:hypothetical protein TNIN_231671, partial [Trichonephila inaurata madagascariensis]